MPLLGPKFGENLQGLLGNPLFMAGMGMLSQGPSLTPRSPWAGALGGLQSAQKYNMVQAQTDALNQYRQAQVEAQKAAAEINKQKLQAEAAKLETEKNAQAEAQYIGQMPEGPDKEAQKQRWAMKYQPQQYVAGAMKPPPQFAPPETIRLTDVLNDPNASPAAKAAAKDRLAKLTYIAPQNADDRQLVQVADPSSPTGISWKPRSEAAGMPGVNRGLSIITNPDGTISVQTGPNAAEKSDAAHAAKLKADLVAREGAVRSFASTTDRVIEESTKDPGSIAVGGSLARYAESFKADAKSLVSVLAPNTPKNEIDNKLLNIDNYDPAIFGTAASASAAHKTAMLSLALQYAIATGMGANGRMTDRDVVLAMRAIGADTSDPRQMAARLREALTSMQTQFGSDVEARNKNYNLGYKNPFGKKQPKILSTEPE